MKKRRPEIWERQKGLCFYCHQPLRLDGDNPATLDHVIPRSALQSIGESILDNFVYACSRCNHRKSNTLPEGWDGKVGDWELTDFGNWVLRRRSS